MNWTSFFKLVLHGSINCLLLAAHVTSQTEETATMDKHDPDAGPKRQTNRSMTLVITIYLSVFFLTGLIFLFFRLCTSFLNRTRGGSLPPPPLGLDPAVVKTFPTFLYSEVKKHRIDQATLECAVCLLEFEDDDILRLLPECCHVFHPNCIDAWLASHDTCPICRANLVPKPGELTPIHRDSGGNFTESNSLLKNGVSGSGQVTNHLIIDINNTTTPEMINMPSQNHPPRSTLRLPEDVRSQLINRSSSGRAEELQQLR